MGLPGATTETSAINWARFSITTNTLRPCSGAPTGRRQQLKNPHSGVIAATNRRLLFVSNSWDDKHVFQLPLHRIASVSHDGVELRIDASPEYAGYMIDGMDDMSRHHSREKGAGGGICITSSGACRNRSPTGISTLNTTATAHLALAVTSTSAPCSSVEAASQNPLTNPEESTYIISNARCR